MGNFRREVFGIKKPRPIARRGFLLPAAATLLSQPIDPSGKSLERPELYGVPGQVRTANLPLRRGMLYPIELLRHKSLRRSRSDRRRAW